MRRDPVLVDLALQGGGAHGAFTWGVLDRLLQEPWPQIDGISGTSAGAMNAGVLADGHAAGGADGARAALEKFWRSVSLAALLSPLRRTPLDVLLGRWTLDHSPAFVAMDLASRLFSPYDLSPSGFNPLRDVLAEHIDFERLAQAPIKVFVTATNVKTGRGHVFRNSAITPEVLLASACLPTMFQAAGEVDGLQDETPPVTLDPPAWAITRNREPFCDLGHRLPVLFPRSGVALEVGLQPTEELLRRYRALLGRLAKRRAA